jgi:hypothetical protein
MHGNDAKLGWDWTGVVRGGAGQGRARRGEAEQGSATHGNDLQGGRMILCSNRSTIEVGLLDEDLDPDDEGTAAIPSAASHANATAARAADALARSGSIPGRTAHVDAARERRSGESEYVRAFRRG